MMNYIKNRLLLLGVIVSWIAAMSAQSIVMRPQQRVHVEKMSITTQMFLDEMESVDNAGVVPNVRMNIPKKSNVLAPEERLYAAPDTIDGELYISAFVTVTTGDAISTLKALGVIVETEFKNGLLTTRLPVDRMSEIAALDCVKRIDVSSVMSPATDRARQVTNVDDVLNHSADAIALNLPHGYDGNGVIIGVIDRGIDFNHIAFKDKDGNCRIKRAYVFNGSAEIDYYGTGELPNDGIRNTDHGSHVSAIAGGSSVMVDGNEVTVTDDHSHATYGGMAPGAELYLCGLNGMRATHIANAFKRICDYADSVGKPVVIVNSYGNNVYNRDGSGPQGEIVSQLFGEDHPDRICLFAAGNNAGHSAGGPGGLYVSGNASSEAPLGTILTSHPMVIEEGWRCYAGEYFADAFTRAHDAAGIGVNIHVLDNGTGEIVESHCLTSEDGNTTLSLNPAYFTNGNGAESKVVVYFDYSSKNGCKEVLLRTTTGFYGMDYSLALEFYPIGGSSDIIDVWSAGNYTFFDNYLSTPGHVWVQGTDDMSAFANACYPETITVGSYVTRPDEESNSEGDISDFSNYAVEGMGPLGVMIPWITAPGEYLVSAYNSNFNRPDSSYTVVFNPSYPYGLMSGTSMATPTVAGVVALWMQAAAECGKQLSLSEVKNIMKETAIRDWWVTDGPHSSHFGNGKIDALAGIRYILEEYGGHDYELGDVNHDGDVTIKDVTALIDYLLGSDEAFCPICADVNGKSGITIADVTALIDILLDSDN